MATQINVPADQPSIQQGIDVASDGDTVIVAPGEYFENINLHGKNILLTSNFFISHDIADIENTIINGSTPADPDTASVVLIISGETNSCVVQGFTISGGTGTRWLDEHGAGTYREGGGFLIQYSSPVIRDNYIMENHVTNYTGVASTGGGAIRCGDSNPLIQNNIIMNNEASGYGGGLVFNYCDHPVIMNNLIANNSGGDDYGGGGIWATGSSSSQNVDLINNTIVKNTATGSGGFGGKGGGVFVFTVTVSIKNSIVWDNNQVISGPLYASGGIFNVSYSDIEGGFTGEGNIDTDPLFTDTLFCFLIDSLSPCVDTGDPSTGYDDIPDAIEPAHAAFPSFGTLRNDMGLFGGPGAQLIADCQDITPVSINNEIFHRVNVLPNPADDFFIIQTDGPHLIELFDGTGKLVSTVNIISKQIVDVSSLEPGLYYLKIISANGSVDVGKVMIR